MIPFLVRRRSLDEMGARSALGVGNREIARTAAVPGPRGVAPVGPFFRVLLPEYGLSWTRGCETWGLASLYGAIVGDEAGVRPLPRAAKERKA